MKKKIISVLSLTILFISSAAQLTSFKEFTETRKDYLHEFIKPGPGLYAVLDYAGPHGVFSSDRNTAKAQYTIYDENLNIRHSAIVEGLKYNNFLGILEGAGSAQVFFEKKNQVFVADLNLETGQFKVPPIGVYKVNSNSDYFYKGYSADSAYGFAISSYTVSRKKHQIFDGVIFDKEMKTIRPFTYKLENPGGTFKSIEVYQNIEGSLLIICSVHKKNKKKEFNPSEWSITLMDKSGKAETAYLNNLPEGQIGSTIWNVTKEGISFTGLLSKTNNEEYKYIISGDFNITQKKLTNIRETELANASFWNTVTDPVLLALKTNGLPFSNTINSIVNPDGTKYLVMQRYYTISGNSQLSGSFRTYYRSYGKSVYALSISADNSINWIKHIPVNQIEYDYQIYTGSIATFHNSKGIYIFYNDNETNINTHEESKRKWVDVSGKWPRGNNTYVVNITPDGTLTRTIAGVYSDPYHHLAPAKPFKLYNTELFFTSFYYKDLGASTYKPCIFIIQ